MATFYTCLHDSFYPELIRSSGEVLIPSSFWREVNKMDVNAMIEPMFDTASNLIHDLAMARIGFAVGVATLVLGVAYGFKKIKEYIKYDVIGW